MGRSNKFWSDPSSFLLFALLSLIPLRGLFLIAARQSVQAPSALAPQRQCSFISHYMPPRPCRESEGPVANPLSLAHRLYAPHPVLCPFPDRSLWQEPA